MSYVYPDDHDVVEDVGGVAQWRCIAGGNAHWVYRHVPPLYGDVQEGGSAQGMVLKVPRLSSHHDSLYQQHHFVSRLVSFEAAASKKWIRRRHLPPQELRILSPDLTHQLRNQAGHIGKSPRPLVSSSPSIKPCFCLLETDLVTPPFAPTELLSVQAFRDSVRELPSPPRLRFGKYSALDSHLSPADRSPLHDEDRSESTKTPEGTSLSSTSSVASDHDPEWTVSPDLSHATSSPPTSHPWALQNDQHACDDGPPRPQFAWVYLTAELKPKSGLPALVERSASSDCCSLCLKRRYVRKGNHGCGCCFHGSKQPSRYTLQQYLKKAHGSVSERSLYSPERFFKSLRRASADTVRQELDLLLQFPQNNWRLFIDGIRIFWADDPAQPRVGSRSNGASGSPSTITKGAFVSVDSAVSDAFYRCFPIEVDLSQESVDCLDVMTDAFAKILHQENDLFGNLSIGHALAEGQQHIAACLFNQVKLQSKSRECRQSVSEALGVKLTQVLEGLGNDKSVGTCAGYLQGQHFSEGLELWERCRCSSLSGSEENAVLKWLSEYLIGRSFLDCSVMINLAIALPTTPDYPTSSRDISRLLEDRFVLMEKSEDLAKRLIQSLQVPVVSLPTCSDIKNTADAMNNTRLQWMGLPDVAEGRCLATGEGVHLLYRVSVVDLDVKQAAKIDQWADQLSDILDIASANASC